MEIMAVLLIAGLIALALMVAGTMKRSRAKTSDEKEEGSRSITIGLAAGSVVFGFLLLRFCFDLIASTPDMPDRAYQVVRLSIGLGAGFVAAGLAGSFEIKTDWAKATIKAGGPTGVAIFFYLVNPMALSA